MATLAGKIIDGDTGEQVPARVRVLASNGEFVHPGDAILKVHTFSAAICRICLKITCCSSDVSAAR